MLLSQIVDKRFHDSLGKLTSAEVPLKTAFKLKGIFKRVQEEYSKYEEVRTAALKSYGKKDEAGELILDENQNVQFDEAGMEAFAKDMTDLMNLEISLPTVTLSELGDKVVLTLNDLSFLDGVVVES